MPSDQGSRTLYDAFLALRDEQRENTKGAPPVIKGRELKQETNQQGLMKWYMHPAIKNTALSTFMFFEQEIPPGSRKLVTVRGRSIAVFNSACRCSSRTRSVSTYTFGAPDLKRNTRARHARLSRDAIVEGLRNWRLHLAVFATTFALFPLLGLGLAHLFTGPVAAGLLFLTLLPSTVQSSIAFTAIARGNVAAAVCSASFSNLIGIVLTPALVALLMGNAGAGISLASIEAIVFQLLVPFVAGHLLRPWIGAWVARQKKMLTLVDRGSILLVVYTAFGAAVVEGLWHRVSAADLALIAEITGLME